MLLEQIGFVLKRTVAQGKQRLHEAIVLLCDVHTLTVVAETCFT